MKEEKFVQINKIQGYEEIREWYWISNSDEDKIMNRSTNKRVKGWIHNKSGYKIVNLRTKNGKMKHYRIHILKASAFLYTPNPLSYNIVRHLNDIKTDNRLINLAWGTISDNVKDCIKNGNFNYDTAAKNGAKTGAKNGIRGAKKLSKPVRCIETGVIYPSTKEAGHQTGINNNHISECCRGNGKRHTAGGFHWEFVNQIAE